MTAPAPHLAALGWTLLHFLWQGALVGLATALLLHVLRRAPAQARHLAACLGLAACLALPAATFIRLWPAPAALETVVETPSAPVPRAGERAPEAPRALRARLAPALPWIVATWALGAAVLSARLLMGLAWLRRLRRRAVEGIPAGLAERFSRLARRMGLRACPRLALCEGTDGIQGPMVQGLWRPAVLLPAAMLTGMDPDLLEALLAHELAHILRRDYLANLLQGLAEILLFYHPAVWWISAQIRATREEACDELAARSLEEPRRLALALAELDRFQLPAPALGAHQGELMRRIQRLLHPLPIRSSGLPWIAPALLALGLAAPLASVALRAQAADAGKIAVSPALLAQIDGLAQKYQLDPDLLRAMAWTESNFDPKARSPLGAQGLLQVIPATARKYGATDPSDPAQVAEAGARYLRFLLDRYQGDVQKAVAAYNCGHEGLDAGRITAEATHYRELVLQVAGAKAVQAETLLSHGEVAGVLRLRPDGKTWDLWTRISHDRNLDLEILPEAGKPYGSLRAGTTDLSAAAWTESRPHMRLEIPSGASFRIRCATGDLAGECRVPAGRTWFAFRFPMTAAPARS